MTDVVHATTLRGGKIHYAMWQTYEVGGGTHTITELMPLCRNGLYTTGTTEYREIDTSVPVDCVRCSDSVTSTEAESGTETPSVPEVGVPAEPEPEVESGTSFAAYTDPGSITVAAIETAWRAIQERHPEVPDVVVVSGGGTETRRGGVRVTWGHFHPEQWDTVEG